jgi:hypothetical protein
MTRLVTTLMTLSLLTAISACGVSTTVQTMWTEPAYSVETEGFSKIFVAGVYASKTNGLVFETAMKDKFAAKGVAAGGWLDSLPFGEDVTKDELVVYLNAHGYDAVLLSQVTDQKTEVDYQSSYSYMGGYHGYYSGAVVNTGYVSTYQIVNIETQLFRVSDEKLIWVGTSEVFDPENASDVIKSLTPALVNTLVQKKYVKPTM